MRIALGSDHRGVMIKSLIANYLRERHHEVVDVGTDGTQAVDYPDYAAQVCERIIDGSVERGILLCGTGVGMSIAANKFSGIRAAATSDNVSAELARSHNDCNVLCLSADLLSERRAYELVDIFLNTNFEGGRHGRRLEKIHLIEIGHAAGLAVGQGDTVLEAPAEASRTPISAGFSASGKNDSTKSETATGSAAVNKKAK